MAPRTMVATAALLLLLLVTGGPGSAAAAATGVSDESCTAPTDAAGCSLCTSYYPEAGMNTAPSERGVKSSLTRHACGFETGDTSECCSPTEGGDHCAVWGSIYPCDDCCGFDGVGSGDPVDADDGGQSPSTATSSLSSPCASPATAATCSKCTSYYPDAIWSDAPSDRGEKSPLTRHACSGDDGDTSECCSPAPDGGATCSVVYGRGEYLYPCDDCGCDDVSPSTSTASWLLPPALASIASMVVSFGIGCLVALFISR